MKDKSKNLHFYSYSHTSNDQATFDLKMLVNLREPQRSLTFRVDCRTEIDFCLIVLNIIDVIFQFQLNVAALSTLVVELSNFQLFLG